LNIDHGHEKAASQIKGWDAALFRFYLTVIKKKKR